MYQDELWIKLDQAFRDCLRHKKNKVSTFDFYDEKLSLSLYEIYDELLNYKYHLEPSSRYIISEPAWREIYAANFRDRIVQHFFMNEINDILETELVDTCCSCRKHKGTSHALKCFKEQMTKLSNNYENEVYCLKIDLSGYFMNINRKDITSKFKNLINNKYQGQFKKLLIYLCDFLFLSNPASNCKNKFAPQMLKHVPERRILKPDSDLGMAIGNLPAQAGSNYNLTKFDADVSKIFPCYVRYVDDIVILSNDKQKLKDHFNQIIEMLIMCGQKPNLRKTQILNCKYGVKFLGKITYPSGVQKPSKQVCARLLEHARQLKDKENIRERIASQIGPLKHYNCRKLIEQYIHIANEVLNINVYQWPLYTRY